MNMALRKIDMMVKFITILFFSFFLIKNSYAESVETTLSRDKVTLGETVTISFSVDKSSLSKPNFSPLEKDFRVLATNYGTTINMINGSMQAQTVWQLTLEPKMTGTLLIPAIDFGKLKSLPQRLIVEEAGMVIKSDDKKQTTVFVQAEVNPLNPYVQSQVIYTFKLFYRTQLDGPRIDPPQVANSTLVDMGEDQSYQRTINGERFMVYEKKFAIFPQKPGKIRISPAHLQASQLDTNANWFSDPFALTASKSVNLATKTFELDVKSIPNQFHGNVWLPAKRVGLTNVWSADLSKWEVGDPITRTIMIEAEGLRADQIPDLEVQNIAGLNVYADLPERNNRIQGNMVIGTWKQKLTYIPNKAQSFNLPSLSVKWWDINNNTNALADLKSTVITVRDKTSIKVDSSPVVSTKTEDPIVHTPSPREQVKIDKSSSYHFYLTPWFWVAILFLMLWLITLGWVWKSKRRPQVKEIQANNEINEKTFVRACKEGNALMVQSYLLHWAKSQCKPSPCNLLKLAEMIDNEDFKNELNHLQKLLYGKSNEKWDGQGLLIAYRQIKKNSRPLINSYKTKILHDPLPPLYPE